MRSGGTCFFRRPQDNLSFSPIKVVRRAITAELRSAGQPRAVSLRGLELWSAALIPPLRTCSSQEPATPVSPTDRQRSTI